MSVLKGGGGQQGQWQPTLAFKKLCFAGLIRVLYVILVVLNTFQGQQLSPPSIWNTPSPPRVFWHELWSVKFGFGGGRGVCLASRTWQPDFGSRLGVRFGWEMRDKRVAWKSASKFHTKDIEIDGCLFVWDSSVSIPNNNLWVWVFFFQLNLLPPYLLCSKGDKIVLEESIFRPANAVWSNLLLFKICKNGLKK